MSLAVLDLPNRGEAVRRSVTALADRSTNGARLIRDPADADVHERIYVPWLGRPTSLAPLAAIRSVRAAGRPAGWVDESGEHGPFGLGAMLWQSCRTLTFTAVDGVTRGIAALLRPGRAALPRAPGTNSGPGLTIVLPILPDLSHTFLYREVRALLRQHPEARVLVLERGPTSPLHPSAAALLDSVQWITPRGVVSRSILCLRYLLFHPRRSRALLALYARQAQGWRGLFGKLPLREPRHPGRAFELAAALQRYPASPVHAYGSTYAANASLGACILLDRPFSLSSYVDFDFDYDFRMLEDKYELSTFFRVCTTYCAERMQQLLPGADPRRLPMLVWGLDPERWRDRPVPPAPALARDGLELFSACRVVEKKGLHLVPEALAMLRERGITARWSIAGDGPERRRIEELCTRFGVEEQVEWLGALPNDQVIDGLATADVALLPCVIAADGERDGIPIFLTEAMALGRIALSTPVSGIPELIEDGANGYLAQPADSAALADRLVAIVDDPATARAVAERGREHVHRTQNAAHSAESLWALIHDEPARSPA